MDENQGPWQPPVQNAPPSTPTGPAPGYYGPPGAGRAPLPPRPGQMPPPPRRMPKRGGSGASGWIKVVVAGVIGALIVLLIMPAVFGVNPYDLVRGRVKKVVTVGTASTARQVTTVVSPTQGATDVTSIAKKVVPAIVNIDVRIASQNSPFFNSGSQEGTGSGVIISPDGYILTNNHVVTDAQDITVTLASGQSLKAKTVGTDPGNDIAVVKIDKTGLPAISFGNSDNLQVGQLVVAVGSPLGFQETVTAGIVSALHRNVSASSDTGQSTTLTDLIQTDAPINPGNSGGALCDSTAKLIGINALIASQSGGSEGIGFAIPIDTAKKVADDIIAGRSVSHPYIGVQGQTITTDVASQYNLPVTEGVYVTRVVSGGPAEKAGIQAGDIIVAANDKPVKSMDDLIATTRKTDIGGKVSVTYYRGTDKKTVNVTVQEMPTSAM